MKLTIKVGSVTNAQRAQKVLKKAGYKSILKKSENPNKAEGCGYSLALNSESDYPVRLIKESGITVYGVDKE